MHFNKVFPMWLLFKKKGILRSRRGTFHHSFDLYIFNSFIFHMELYFKDKNALQ